MSGAQGTPKDAEGQEIVRQFKVLERHRREQIYDLSGNHDRSGLDEPQAWWWRKWIDPTGEHSEFSGVDASKRPFPIEGTWERYSFRVGNLLFLMMSDINEPSQKVGAARCGEPRRRRERRDVSLVAMVQENRFRHRHRGSLCLKDTTVPLANGKACV
jgi:hypothetical protein